MQWPVTLGEPGQRSGDFTCADVVVGFHITDDIKKEIQFFILERIQNLLRELLDTAIGNLAWRGHRELFDLLPRGAFDHFQHVHFARGDEQDRPACAACAARAADAMHVGFGVIGHVIVDDVADARDVDAARGHVGGHDDVEAAAFQAFDDLLAQALRHVAIQGGDSIATCLELVGQFNGGDFGTHENDGGIEVGFDFKNSGEGFDLLPAVGLAVKLLRGDHGAGRRTDFDFLRLTQMLVRHTADHIRHGGREECGLARGRGVFEDPFHVIDKTHAQHFIGFVEHHEAELVEHQALALQMVHHPTRRADDHMRAA